MPAEYLSATSPTRRLRADAAEDEATPTPPTLAMLAWVAMGAGFVLACAGNLDLGPAESRLAMAVGSPLGPYGQVFGKWEPGIWPAQVAACRVWAWGEGGRPTSASLRWPAALAGLVLGAILSRRQERTLGTRAGMFLGLAWFGSLALMDRSAILGVDLVAALGLVAALDRLIGKGSGLVAGLWAALAFLAGGWPPLAILGVATIVLGREEARFSWRMALPPAIAFAAWTAWAWAVAPADRRFAAWATALSLPLLKSPDWTLGLEVLGLGLPWAPLAALAAWRSTRESWPEGGRALVVGWLQVAGAAVLAGTLIPGLGEAARLPALAGLIVAAAAVVDLAWADTLRDSPRRALLAIVGGIALLGSLAAGFGGVKLVSEVAYYRPVGLFLVGLAVVTLLTAITAAWCGRTRWAIGAVAGLALTLKLAHAGYYEPEWNYQFSQGKWGRAIGQWVPPRWPIYTFHDWPADLAFATGHPVRQLNDERQLSNLPEPGPKFVLLLPSEFAHWRRGAPKLLKIREFQDQRGDARVLARTEGDYAWYKLVKEARDRDKE